MMQNPVGVQARLFLVCIAFGFALGLFYVLLGVFRRGRRSWPAALADGFFWIIVSPAIFVFFMKLNGGDIRGYLLFAIAAGGAASACGGYFLFRKRKRIKK